MSRTVSSLWPHARQRLAGVADGVHGRLQSRQTMMAGRAVDFRGGSHHDTDYDDGWLGFLLQHTDGAFVDLGCNIGYFGLLACVLDPGRDVLLVDANAEALALAAGNLIRSGFGANARFVRAFVSADEGEVEFFTVGAGEAGSRYAGHADTARERGAHQLVPTQSLDHLASTWGHAVGLVKVDVEGAEREVLEGAMELVAADQPSLLVEMHSPPELPMEANARAVLDWCDRSGYHAWYLAEHELLADPARIAHRGRCHLLLQPSSRPYPMGLSKIPQGASLESVLEPG